MAIVPVEKQSVPRFKSRVLLPVFAVTVTAVLLSAFGLYWATTRSDAVSVERQIRATQLALSSTLDELAAQQEVVAVWEDPVIKLDKKRVDWNWIDKNVGTWMYDVYRHDRVYILNGKGESIYAMEEGKRVSPKSYAEVQDKLKPLIDDVRGHGMNANNIHERLPGRTPHPLATVRTTENAVHATDLLEVLGRPAAVSVMRIDDPQGSHRSPRGAEYLHISIRLLDGGFLEEVSKRNLIEKPRFSRSPDREAGESSIPLISEGGAHIGYFYWRPELPGTAVLRALAPITASSALLMMIIMTVLAKWLRRAMREQQATMVELQASEAQAQHMAFHDALTGLPNRAWFHGCLDQALERVRHGQRVAIFLLDLDRFKNVNDTLGHLAGDALIREFAVRLSGLVNEGDRIARLGGDEFAILSRKAVSPGEVDALSKRILGAVRHPFSLFGNSAHIGASIGVAIAPEAGLDRDDLLRKADIALYRAKGEGRDCYRLFTAAMDESVKLRGTIEEELRGALKTGEGLRVYYQPLVDSARHTIIGLEALVRWQHPKRGLISPEHFIVVAEETGLIGQLGEWVLRQACDSVRRWPDLFIAVNLSPTQIRSSGFAERVLAILKESGTDPHRIELEVTEGVLLNDDNQVRDAIKILRGAGIGIALDDFGTGYSSLSYLRRFDVDKIKIDRSFVQQLGDTADSAAIVTAVVTLGHAMGLSVTAEGVETDEQSRFLSAIGCDSLQGYLFSPPVPEEEVAQLLTRPRKARAVALGGRR
jgi:diguanylate cyclase (GGDEF)-like protein